MLIFFKGKTSSPQGIFGSMSAQAESALASKKSNFNPVQVQGQIPEWMKKTEENTSSGLGLFLQSYYDWLVNSYGFTGVNVLDFSKLMDIDETPDFLLKHFIESYAPDILGIYDLPQDLMPTPENIRNTLTNIKTEVYQRKSNEEAFRSLMGSLFSIDPETIRISYPKRKILRLNAGILDWMTDSTYYGTTGEYSNDRYTIVGSHLNQGILPDGQMWQDFSYVLSSEIDDSNPYYEAVVKETLHPAGLLGIYEKLETYSEGGFDPGPGSYYEIPKISNYYPYTLGSVETLPQCSGCTTTSEFFRAGWTFPTFQYPSWSSVIAGRGVTKPFGNILINDFFYELKTNNLYESPNYFIGTNCNLTCTATGSAAFDWFVIRDELFYYGVTSVLNDEKIYFLNESLSGFNSFLWQFGDGTTASSVNPIKQYSSPGLFGVTLTAFKISPTYSNSLGGITFTVI